MCERTALAFRLLESGNLTIGGEAVGIVGVVVVQAPVSIHIAHIVSVAGGRGPEPPENQRDTG